MPEPFELRTARQRAVVFVGFLTYFVLVAIDILSDSAGPVALEDLVLAVLALPAGLIVVRRVVRSGESDVVALLAGVAFVVAGLTTGYDALAALVDLPVLPLVEAIGAFALLVGVVLYLYYTWS